MAAIKGLLGLPAFLYGVAALFWCARLRLSALRSGSLIRQRRGRAQAA